ncbi:unnamed protein product [Effrenium voratum]|nr:unnamed protein product [Effrenium voratum]
MARSSCLDWPLSQAEKRGRLLQLYDKDVQAAERLLKTLEPSQATVLGGDLRASSSTLGQGWPWQLWTKAAETITVSLGHLSDRLAAASAEPAAVSEPAPAAVSCRPSILRARSEGLKEAKRVSFADAQHRARSRDERREESERHKRRSRLRGRLHGFE